MDSEIKEDHDAILKDFLYFSFKCAYAGGEPKIPSDIEKVEWIPKEKLNEYDLVPPTAKLFKQIGYLS